MARVHTITQDEGGTESLLAFVADVHTVSMPERSCDIHRLLEESLWVESGIRVHEGKTQVWNATGERPGCERLQRAAVLADPAAVVWRGSAALPSHRRGMLGTPLGHQDFVCAQLVMLSAYHHTQLARIPTVEDVQSAWLVLVPCASARANCVARVVELQVAEAFGQRHDAGVWQSLCRILQISPEQGEDVVEAASVLLVPGGVGLRSACRVSSPAFLASWAILCR